MMQNLSKQKMEISVKNVYPICYHLHQNLLSLINFFLYFFRFFLAIHLSKHQPDGPAWEKMCPLNLNRLKCLPQHTNLFVKFIVFSFKYLTKMLTLIKTVAAFFK